MALRIYLSCGYQCVWCVCVVYVGVICLPLSPGRLFCCPALADAIYNRPLWSSALTGCKFFNLLPGTATFVTSVDASSPRYLFTRRGVFFDNNTAIPPGSFGRTTVHASGSTASVSMLYTGNASYTTTFYSSLRYVNAPTLARTLLGCITKMHCASPRPLTRLVSSDSPQHWQPWGELSHQVPRHT